MSDRQPGTVKRFNVESNGGPMAEKVAPVA